MMMLIYGLGLKFVLTAEAGTPDMDGVLKNIYELYTDYVLKARQTQLYSCSLLTNICVLYYHMFIEPFLRAGHAYSLRVICEPLGYIDREIEPSHQ